MKKEYKGYEISVVLGKHGWHYFITKADDRYILYISAPHPDKNRTYQLAKKKVDEINNIGENKE